MSERFTLSPFEAFVLPTRTRFPFRYGIASMTDVPHLFLRTRVTIGARSEVGLTAEGLPPKWFTKDPATSFDQDLPEMLAAIGHATRCAEAIARQPVTFFELWRELNRQQTEWAGARQMAPLLAHLGVSLVERAVLDGRCRLAGQPLHRMLTSGQLAIRLGEVYDELGTARPEDLLPAAPLETCFVRHTVGLGDALGPGDIPDGERVDDGLPQDLESCIRAYGLRYFKVKLRGDVTTDGPRLRELQRLLARETGGDYRVTIDGNENFADFDAFRQFWDQAVSDDALTGLRRRIIVVEQPVHRDRALSDHARHALQAWLERPALIIDESDGAIGDVPRALDLGYAGASFKSCKGIVKGLANASLLAARRAQGQPGVLTGEDLCTLGPIALSQDLAMMALLGIDHVERNGHHYYRGLSMLPAAWQAATLAEHGDLYARHPDDFACVRIHDGALRLGSVNAAPLGVQPRLDPSGFATETLPV
jgi:L-alanine-DL-glutamate epimerase-like enolase superfamily enzyme